MNNQKPKRTAIIAVVVILSVFVLSPMIIGKKENQEANIFLSIKNLFKEGGLRGLFQRNTDNPWRMSEEAIVNLPPPENGILHAFDVPVRYDTSIKPKDGEVFFDPPIIPYEGPTPLWYQEVTGDERNAFGYPRSVTEFDKIFARKNGKEVSLESDKKSPSLVSIAEAYEEDAEIPGLVHCKLYPEQTGGYFKAWFEDVAASNGQNFDEDEFGLGRRQEACQVLEDVAELVKLDETQTTPNILFPIEQYSDLPGYVLGAASAFFYPYVNYPDNGSLYQHIVSGNPPQFGYMAGSFDEDQEYAYFDARIFINFSDFEWDVDSGELTETNFDLYSVLLHELVHTMGIASRPSLNANQSHAGDPVPRNFFYSRLISKNLQDQLFPLLNFDGTLSNQFGLSGGQNFDQNNEVLYHPLYIQTMPELPVFSPNVWSAGSSLSHFDKNRAQELFGEAMDFVMHPSLSSGQENTELHEHEKEALCDLGYAVEGVSDFCESGAPFASLDLLEEYPVDAETICANPLQNDSLYGGEEGSLFIKQSELVINTNGDVELGYFSEDDCEGQTLSSPDGARSVQFTYSNLEDFFYTRLSYTNQDGVTQKESNVASLIVSNCGPSVRGPGYFDFVCNGSFEITTDPDGTEESRMVREGAVHGWHDIGWHNGTTPSEAKIAWTNYDEFSAENNLTFEPCTFDAPCNSMSVITEDGINPHHQQKYIFVEQARISDNEDEISFPVLKTKLKEPTTSSGCGTASCFIKAVLMPNDQDAFTPNFEHHIRKELHDEDLSSLGFFDGLSWYEFIEETLAQFSTYDFHFILTDSDSDDYVDICIILDRCGYASAGFWSNGLFGSPLDKDFLYIFPMDFNREDEELDGLASFGVDSVGYVKFSNSPYLPYPGGTGFDQDQYGLVGQVFLDQNQNGFRDFSEPHLPNRSIHLYSELNDYGSIQDTTTTSINGYYGFNVSNSANVALLLEHSENEIITMPGVQSFEVAGEDRFISVIPTPNTQQLGLDFGIYYAVLGCTDSTASNYNPDADIDDGSCTVLVVFGCTDQTALNYNPDATVSDGSCEFPSTLSGRVYYDEDINSMFTPGEPAISNGTVKLYSESDTEDPLMTTNPGTDGSYSFEIGEEGSYHVVYVPVGSDLVFTEPESGMIEIEDITEIHSVDVSLNQTYTDRNFGIVKEDVLDLMTDIGVVKTLSSPQINSADTTIEYTIVVTNYGPNPASGIVLNDVLPSSLTFNEGLASVPGLVYNPVTGYLSFNATLQPGQSVTIILKVSIKKYACGPVTNTVSLSSFQGFDSNPSNNTSGVSFKLRPCSSPVPELPQSSLIKASIQDFFQDFHQDLRN